MTAAALQLARVVLVDAPREVEGAPAHPRGKARTMSVLATKLIRAFGIDLSVEGSLPRAPTIVVANHLGWIDPFLVLHAAPCVPVAKSEIGDWPVVKKLFHGAGVALVKRGDAHSGASVLRRAWRTLDAGVSVLNFAEGTTSRGNRVLPFKRGVFGLARRANVAITPVRIDYACADLCWVGDDLFVPNAIKLARHPWPRMRVRFLDPIACGRRETPEEFAERARLAIQEA